MRHHEHARPSDFGNAFKIGIGLNIGFVVIEFFSGFWFNSVSLLADAGHNLSDVFGLILAYAAFRLATVKPTKKFSYGLGSSTILASTINGGLLLFAVGAITWEAVGRFWNPVETHGGGVIAVAAIGVVINALTATLFFRGRSHDLNIKGAYLHMLADALVSAGVAIGGIVMVLTAWSWVDPIISLLIAGVIFYTTWDLFRDSLNLHSHGVPKGIDLEEVNAFLESFEEVESVHDLHVWALSTTKTALTAHLVIGDAKINRLTKTVVDGLKEQFEIDHATIHVEFQKEYFECALLGIDCG